MGVGAFEKPEPGPKVGGPKVGETIEYDKLPPERKAELGDLDALKVPTPEPELSEEDKARAAEGAEKLAATQAVLAKEEEIPPGDLAEALLEEMAEPTVEDRREFLRGLLGNGIYEKRYEMYGGMLVMTLHDITPALEDQVFVAMSKLLKDGDIETDDDWALWLDRIRLMTNVSVIRMARGGDIDCKLDPELGAEQLAAQAGDRVKVFPSTALYRAALQTVRVFSRHMEIMLDRALDSDFWEVGGLDSPSEPTSEEPSNMA